MFNGQGIYFHSETFFQPNNVIITYLTFNAIQTICNECIYPLKHHKDTPGTFSIDTFVLHLIFTFMFLDDIGIHSWTITTTKWKWVSRAAGPDLPSHSPRPHPNLSMVDCISKTRMPLFADRRVSVWGHLVFSCQFYVALWCKDYDRNKNNCGHERCKNIVPKCYCGDKGLVIS